MILIISNEIDQSTSLVMDWLYSWDKKILRINETDEITVEGIEISNNYINISLKAKDILFTLNEITSYWYRRGFLFTKYLNFNPTGYVKSHLKNELSVIIDYIHFSLSRKRHLGSYFNNNQNKLLNLELAQESGLKIPTSLISTNKNKISNFKDENSKIITKAIHEAIAYITDDGFIQAYTSEIIKTNLVHYNESIFPSLVQQKIEKLFELRIFFLDGHCYSMAIFSQQNEQTSTDFRKYSTDRPNRNVPYNLPSEIEDKILIFMKSVRLNTGSIDMVVTPSFDYVFLEVNPIGQYGMTSYPCNYNLDFKIAEYLCKTF
jgi:ATP-GRASP peptide maturase of grasp-with-spasm system